MFLMKYFFLFATVSVITEIVSVSFNTFMQLSNPNCPRENRVKQTKINLKRFLQNYIFYPNANASDPRIAGKIYEAMSRNQAILDRTRKL